MSSRAIPGLALLAVLLGATAARADEIRLKDGTKISGTIVGFENGSFRVETSYGFALIQKDKVADINITAAKKEPEPKAKSNMPVAPPAASPRSRRNPFAGGPHRSKCPAPERASRRKNASPRCPKPKTVASKSARLPHRPRRQRLRHRPNRS